jgi:UDP-3-O-[3-hydroxymyristoyl] glucosamine N-acyltransferase
LSCVSRSEDSFGDDKFKKWQNGGGIFHESACIDSTAFLDVGAIVHSQSIVASNVRIGSGTVVGPSVSIAHSTQIGYTLLFLCNFVFHFIYTPHYGY